MEELIALVTQYAVFPIALVCFGVGYIIKHHINEIPNKFIPLILSLLGLFLNIIINDFNFSFEILVTGMASGLVATGSFEAVRNLIDNKNKDNEVNKG